MNELYTTKIDGIEQRDIIACDENMPVHEAAAVMALHKTGCLFVKNAGEEIVGYVTDITLRDNVVAKQADLNQPVKNIMDNPIVSISSNTYVYEAILMMFRTKTRYLLITKTENIPVL